ncbi:HAMP domain-containing protein [Loktanella fryxellensis]|uniref:Signal transduction histidine-protein kinase/phosphatase MprB n=1 Tax=Loktanella fryxellensis TaxID=245187 RepID=A0A1H7ZJE6_9RHOB|nr:ATP-binding protein [Loktanella fryxellensis]SEM58702.1 HAMP domain-containing protein [Loktanella fryxellensis]
MTIRTKILFSHLIVTLAVALIACLIILILQTGAENRRQSVATYDQIRAINLIAARANDYSEQVAELFILGPDMREVIDARAALDAALTRKEDLVRAEIALITDPAERTSETAELVHLDRMRDTLAALDVAQADVMQLLNAGQRAAAVVLYIDRIEHRFDSVMGQLIDVATDRERAKVEQTAATSDMLARRVFWLAVGLVAVVALLLLANGVVLHRAILRPVAALADGADAVGRGDLDHRVPATAADELGHLGRRFNAMTTQIGDQQTLLRQTKADLERHVAHRTAELHTRSQELEAAVTRLKALDETRARFLADISHELRTPLTILRGQAEVTLRAEGTSPDRLRETLRQVVRKAAQMGRRVEDLLFLARSEAGVITVASTPVILQDVMADVLQDCDGFARAPGVTVTSHHPDAPVVVMGDHDRLRQALLIPLDNAIRLAPADSIVRLDLDVAGDAAVIRIVDQGPGFTAAESEQAFARFYQGGAGRGGGRPGGGHRGAGLGLSIARWIVDRHAGTIRIVRSSDDHDASPATPSRDAALDARGATIAITLPLERDRA